MGHDANPWDDWIPGVLSKRQVKLLIDKGLVAGVKDPSKSIDASSLDLTLSSEVYLLPDGAIKPSGPRYQDELNEFGQPLESANGGDTTLEARQTYVVKLQEQLNRVGETRIFGMATAKSSVGRIDVLARLIVDGMNCYEYFNPERELSGALFLEITPLTFSVRIRPGESLSQLRLFYGDPEDCRLSGKEANATFLKHSSVNDDTLSIDLEPVDISGEQVIGFRAKENPDLKPIPLWGLGQSSPDEYWNFVSPEASKRLRLKKNSFYILRSKEWLALPKGVAVYCRANDESFGEMRIHYAGFAHPMFGRSRKDDQIGTPLIFEVRGHDVNVSLKDGESMARLLFYRMSEDAAPSDAGDDYETQILKLSKFFAAWPKGITVDADGAVQLAK
jgi:dCTP deaminase